MSSFSGKKIWGIAVGGGLIAVAIVLVLLLSGGSNGKSTDRASGETTTSVHTTTTDGSRAPGDDASTRGKSDRNGADDSDAGDNDGDGTSGKSGNADATGEQSDDSPEQAGRGTRGTGSGSAGSTTPGTSGGRHTDTTQTTSQRPGTTRPPSTTTRPTGPATTRPGQTTTTRPGQTTTTRPGQTTTTRPGGTTTTVPGRVTPGPDPAKRDTAGWRFEPSTLLLAPGEVTEVELVHADPSGVDTNGLPPTNPSMTFSDPGAATIAPLGEGRFRVTAGTGVGFTAVGADVPHTDLNVPLLVTVATTKPGVTKIADDAVVWPRVDKDELAPPRDFSLPYQDADGVGSFTWQHIKDLALTPASDAAETGVPEYRFALVLRDMNLAVGDLVVSSGDSSVLGRVMQVESQAVGDHTLSLVSIELVSPRSIFDDVKVDYSTRDLIDVGALAPPAEPGDLVPVPAPKTTGSANGGAGPFAKSFHPSAVAQLARLAEEGAEEADEPDVGECRLESGEANLLTITPTIALEGGNSKTLFPTFDALFDMTNGGAVMMQVVGGMSGKLKTGIEVKATLSGKAELKCGLAKLGTWALPAPAPIGPFLTLEAEPKVFATFGVAGSGGPVFSYKKECTSAIDVQLGFRYNEIGGERYKSLSHTNNSGTCEDKTTVSDGVGGPSYVSTKIEGSFALTVGTPLKIRLGGMTISRIAETFGLKDFGLLDMFKGEGGLVGKVAWANTSSVLDAQETPALAQLSAMFNITIEAEPFQWTLKKLASFDAELIVEMPKIEFELPLAQAFRGISKGSDAPEVSVDGDPVTNGVAIGDQLDVKAVTKASAPLALGGLAAPFTTSKLTAYVKTSSNYEKLVDMERDKLSQPSDREAGPTIEAHFEITKAVCDKLDGKELDVAVISTSSLFGLDTPGYVTAFKLKCVDPDIRWDPDTIEVENHKKGKAVGKSELQIIDPGAGEAAFSYTLTEDFDWLTVEGADGTNTMHYVPTVQVDGKPHDAMVAEVKATVDCKEVGDRKAIAFVTGTLDAPDFGKPLTKDLTINADCRTNYAKITPKSFKEPGGTATIEYSAGQKGEAWSISGGDATPSSGVFPSDDEGVISVEIKFKGPDPECDQSLPGKVTTGELVSKYAEGEVFDKIIPPKNGPPCAPPPPPCVGDCGVATGWGEPHLTSFDGVRFDMQTPGDYRYVVPDPADPNATGPQLQVRHGYYLKPGSDVKVIEAAAVDYGGHRVEAYVRPDATVLVDGVAHDWNESVALELRSDFTLSINKGKLTMNAAGVNYTLDYFASTHMNLSVRAPKNSAYRGILGSPDGNAANDLSRLDGSTISLAQAHAGGLDFFTFTESWRVTDVADSLFSVASDSFDESPTPFDMDAIMPFVGQVRTAFADLSPVCGGLSGLDPTSYAVVSIAVELAAGTPLAEAMNYTCAYQLAGTVKADLQQLGLGLGGVNVHITAPGLTSCDAVTSTRGDFYCSVTPDITALRAGGVPDAPPTFRYVVTHPISGNTIIDSTNTAKAKATFGASTYVGAALSTPNRVDGSVDLIGNVTRGGTPLANQRVGVDVTEWDANGKLIFWDYRYLNADAQGVYKVIRATHPLAAKLRLKVDVGGDWYTKIVDLTQPASGEVRLDIDHNPPVVTFQGAWNAALGKSVLLRGIDADGKVVSTKTLPVTVTDGQWSVTHTFPASAVRVEVSALVSAYAADNPVLVTPVTNGPSTKTFDVAFTPVSAQVHGTVKVDGVSTARRINVNLQAFDASGVRVANLWSYPLIDAATGAYRVDAEAPQSATRMVVTMQPDDAQVTWQVADVPLVQGVNDVPLSADVHRDVVNVTGTLQQNGAVPTGAVPVTIVMQNRTGQQLGSVTQDLTAAPDGSVTWASPVTLPFGTTNLHVTAKFFPEAGGSLSQDIPIVAGETTTASFDLNLVMRVITMNITATSKDGPFNPFFQLYWKNGTVQVGSAEQTPTVTPDAQGHATLSFIKPMSVDNVDINAMSFDRNWVRSSVTFGADPNVTIDLDIRPRQIHLTGAVTKAGSPAPAGPRDARLVALDASDKEIAQSAVDTTINVAADGTYASDLSLPEWSPLWSGQPAKWKLVVTGSDSLPHELALGSVPRGVTNRAGQNFVEVDGVALTVLTKESPPEALRISAITWVPGSNTNSPTQGKWVETPIPPSAVAVETLGSGSYKLTTQVAPDATFVRISNQFSWSRVVALENPGAANTISTETIDPTSEIGLGILNFGSGAQAVEGYGGSPTEGNYCIGQPYPIVMQVTVTAKVTSGPSPFDLVLGTYLVFPDQATGRYHVDLPSLDWEALGMAAPPDEYELSYAAHDAYNPFSTAAWGSTTIPAADYGFNKPTWEYTPGFGCAA